MNDAKEEIRAKLNIEDVIGEYVQLKRAGRYYKGLSPFTNERTPSFFVTPDKDIWHDFSSGKGGDIFSFIMEVEGLDFKGALELLARKAGVDLSRYQSHGQRSLSARKERIYQMNDLAVNYYQRCLVKSKTGLGYAMKKRRLTKETIMQWGIGYAPDHPQLKQLLIKKGYKTDEMKDAGLLSYRGNELFRGRMMIPLRDRKGQVVGFTGRIIGDGQPKYLNTPDTLLYHKGQQLFGLNFAATSIRKQNFSVIVEGNLDVITSHQAGTKNVVGVAGTALTADHLKSLGRISNDVRFCFDSDKAGVAATERAIKLAGPLELKLSVISYAGLGSKDPDELIHDDPNKWQAALEHYQSAVNWVRDYYIATVGVDTVEGKKVVADKTLSVIAALNDPVEREGYIRELAEKTDTSVTTLVSRLKMIQGEEEKEAHPRKVLKPVKTAKSTPQQRRDSIDFAGYILAYLGANPTKRSTYLPNINDDELSSTDRQIKQLLLTCDAWGEALLNKVDAAMDENGTDLSILQQVRDRLGVLIMLDETSVDRINGIKSDADLLDYCCQLECEYYTKLWRELTKRSISSSVTSEEAEQAAKSARACRKLTEQLSPAKNRRTGYAGLKALWSSRRRAESNQSAPHPTADQPAK